MIDGITPLKEKEKHYRARIEILFTLGSTVGAVIPGVQQVFAAFYITDFVAYSLWHKSFHEPGSPFFNSLEKTAKHRGCKNLAQYLTMSVGSAYFLTAICAFNILGALTAVLLLATLKAIIEIIYNGLEDLAEGRSFFHSLDVENFSIYNFFPDREQIQACTESVRNFCTFR